MEDVHLGDDSHGHMPERQPLTCTPLQYQQNHQWRPTTPNMTSPPPLTNTSPMPPRRATGKFSRQWKSPPTASARTSSETIRPPPSPSSISSGDTAALPRKYIGPEMNKVLHRHRLSVESGMVIGRRSERDSIMNRRGRKTLASTSLLRWIPEVGAIVGAVVCLVAIAVLLKSYNGKPQPDWPGPFTLHSVVALLAVLAQAAYLVPVVQGLGQLCWLRYSGSSSGHNYSRPLRDFEVIDSATRGGIHGSFGLLFGYKKGGILGILGALIIITSLFTTPLTQGMISYTAELIPGDLTDTDPSRNAKTAADHRASSLNSGTPYTNRSMVHIHWGYLVPLLTHLILSAVFLASVVICTRRDGIQIIKTCSLATMVALKDDGTPDITGRSPTAAAASSIGSIANMAELRRQSSTVRVRLEKDALSGLALGLVAPVYDAGEDHQESSGFLVDGLCSRKEDVESRLTATRTRIISSARDAGRRRNMNRNTRILGGVVQ
ncbi:hypothetical protein QBC37DRAFT_449565 [Rhypophila decipiens]|uniref:Uncharacterized protein n=1 Tax=Rhypophila decipiens TaxID=261697 RepID=A0AAN6YDT1_9PEZI|nr:hypothetical protein QBC37DRAFT_449565 [Rhypophila decipiens]